MCEFVNFRMIWTLRIAKFAPCITVCMAKFNIKDSDLLLSNAKIIIIMHIIHRLFIRPHIHSFWDKKSKKNKRRVILLQVRYENNLLIDKHGTASLFLSASEYNSLLTYQYHLSTPMLSAQCRSSNSWQGGFRYPPSAPQL